MLDTLEVLIAISFETVSLCALYQRDCDKLWHYKVLCVGAFAFWGLGSLSDPTPRHAVSVRGTSRTAFKTTVGLTFSHLFAFLLLGWN